MKEVLSKKVRGSSNTEDISLGSSGKGVLAETYAEKPNEAIPESDPLNKIFKEINSLKERVDTDRERALDEIEKSKNLVHYGFIALLFVTVFGIAGLCFSYFEYVSEGPIVESYKKDFKEDISGGRAEIENLKTESDSLRKQIRSCSHEVSFWNYRQCLGNM
jgi:DNA repair exonuclease SbcCD ATPase subunit